MPIHFTNKFSVQDKAHSDNFMATADESLN